MTINGTVGGGWSHLEAIKCVTGFSGFLRAVTGNDVATAVYFESETIRTNPPDNTINGCQGRRRQRQKERKKENYNNKKRWMYQKKRQAETSKGHLTHHLTRKLLDCVTTIIIFSQFFINISLPYSITSGSNDKTGVIIHRIGDQTQSQSP